MNKITHFHNYDNGYIGLIDLALKGLPETIIVEGYALHRKSEFHISLICAKRIAALIDPINSVQIETAIVSDFIQFVQSNPLTDYQVSREFRFVERDQKKTLVVMVAVPDIESFFEVLRQKYGTELPLQPTHITLYTLQPEIGIGILSQEELLRDYRLVEVTELANAPF